MLRGKNNPKKCENNTKKHENNTKSMTWCFILPEYQTFHHNLSLFSRGYLENIG